ncbi:MAG: hypothetical protein LBU79_01060 [Planctomycetota bacterium]|jgi:flagellar motor switch protein FliG|nr:hypothetical protein [Planctomycetota bacterium]
MQEGRDNPFAYLDHAKPGSIFKLLEKMPEGDQAMALANLPPLLSAQVLAYFSDSAQANIQVALREARRSSPEMVSNTANRLLDRLRTVRDARNATSIYPAPPGKSPASRSEVTPGQLKPWRPRVSNENPINVPHNPNQAPAIAGDPAYSPLLGLFGLDSGKTAGSPFSGKNGGKSSGPVKPDWPREGTLNLQGKSIHLSKKPRVIGTTRPIPPVQPRQAAGEPEPQKMDGMAILAAILRNSTPEVRQNVSHDSPELYRALKERMFVFDDLLKSDDSALGQIFTVASLEDAALALRFGPPVLRDRAYQAVSPRRAELLRNNRDGKAGLDDIEQAQTRVLNVALKLQGAGRILIDPDEPDLA